MDYFGLRYNSKFDPLLKIVFHPEHQTKMLHSPHEVSVPQQLRDIYTCRATAFDAVIVPGGYCPDYLRRYPSVLKFVRDAHDRGEVIAAICHAPWVLVSAGLLKGRTVTCFRSIKDDVVNAGARYVDREVVRDGNIITSRFPDDLPAFCREIITALEEMKVAPLKGRAR